MTLSMSRNSDATGYARWQLVLYALSALLCVVVSVLSFCSGSNLFRAYPFLSCLFMLFVWSIDRVPWGKVFSTVHDKISDLLLELWVSSEVSCLLIKLGLTLSLIGLFVVFMDGLSSLYDSLYSATGVGG